MHDGIDTVNNYYLGQSLFVNAGNPIVRPNRQSNGVHMSAFGGNQYGDRLWSFFKNVG